MNQTTANVFIIINYSPYVADSFMYFSNYFLKVYFGGACHQLADHQGVCCKVITCHNITADVLYERQGHVFTAAPRVNILIALQT